MTFFSRVLDRIGLRKMTSLDLFREVYGSRQSSSGVDVNWQRALQVSTVFACVRVIANGVAQVSWPLYLTDGRSKAKATEHPLYALLNTAPNKDQTAFDFRRTLVFHLCLTGNAYVWVGRVGTRREVRVMEIIEPGRVTVIRAKDGTLTYSIRADDGAVQVFGETEIWHVRGPSWNGWQGMDAIKLARDAIGLAISTETSQADYHKNEAKVSGLLSTEGTLSKEKFEFLSAWLDKHSTGGDRAGKPLVMDMDAKFTPFRMTGVDAQHLETRKHQIEEVCRSYGVLPIMVGHSDKTATYASAEQMFIAHVIHTMTPWYAMLEQSADLHLLTNEERAQGYYTKFNANAMMRGAAKDRGEFYAKALGAGGHGTAYLTPNEVRDLEDRDPIEGGDTLPAGAQPVQGA